jgi:hypothetical protein
MLARPSGHMSTGGMMQKRDNQREAKTLIRYYADGSLAVATQRLRRACAAGDVKEERMWCRVAENIRYML